MSNNIWYFFVFILILVSIYWYKKRIKLEKNYPPATVFHSPSKIYFNRTVDEKYHVGTLALDIFTIGGHGRVKAKTYEYETHYLSYSSQFNSLIDCRNRINSNLNNIGKITYDLLKELERSRSLMQRPSVKSQDYSFNTQFAVTNKAVDNLNKVIADQSNTGVVLLQGSVIGGLAAIGTWTFVATLGTASTGTAIAGLSGIAAHNAILAWLGGGALATGGGGMAAGAATLGVIVAIPAIIYSAYKTHSLADELENKIPNLISQIDKLKLDISQHEELEQLTQVKFADLKSKYASIHRLNNKLEKIIYPNGYFSKIKRDIYTILNQDFYTEEEYVAMKRVMDEIDKLDFIF